MRRVTSHSDVTTSRSDGQVTVSPELSAQVTGSPESRPLGSPGHRRVVRSGHCVTGVVRSGHRVTRVVRSGHRVTGESSAQVTVSPESRPFRSLCHRRVVRSGHQVTGESSAQVTVSPESCPLRAKQPKRDYSKCHETPYDAAPTLLLRITLGVLLTGQVADPSIPFRVLSYHSLAPLDHI